MSPTRPRSPRRPSSRPLSRAAPTGYADGPVASLSAPRVPRCRAPRSVMTVLHTAGDRKQQATALGEYSGGETSKEARRELLGDQDHGLLVGDDPVGPEDDLGGGIDPEVAGAGPRRLAAHHENVAKRLGAVLREQDADRLVGPDQIGRA